MVSKELSRSFGFSQHTSNIILRSGRLSAWLLVLISLVIFGILIWTALFPRLGETVPSSARYPLLFIAALYGAFGGIVLWMERRRFPSALAPEREQEDKEASELVEAEDAARKAVR